MASRSDNLGVKTGVNVSLFFCSGVAGGVTHDDEWLLCGLFVLCHRGWLLTTKKYSTSRCCGAATFNVCSEAFRRSFEGVDVLPLFPIFFLLDEIDFRRCHDPSLDADFDLSLVGDGVFRELPAATAGVGQSATERTMMTEQPLPSTG